MRDRRTEIPRYLLLTFLGLGASIEGYQGIMTLIRPETFFTQFNIPSAQGIEIPLTFLGIQLCIRSAVEFTALFWVLLREAAGVALARLIGWAIVVSAAVVYVKLHAINLMIGNLASGTLILAPAYLISTKIQSP